MQVVFDTKTVAAAKRRQAWRDAICEIYLQVDCAAEQQGDYDGFVREMRFGDVTLTDALISPQSVRRQSQHIAHFDKDYYYAGIEQIGRLDILQGGSSLALRPGMGGLYYANEPYELRCNVKTRQFWIELPREAFDRRFELGRPPLLTPVDLGKGLGPHRRRILRFVGVGRRWPRSAHQSIAGRAVYGHLRPGFKQRAGPSAGSPRRACSGRVCGR